MKHLRWLALVLLLLLSLPVWGQSQEDSDRLLTAQLREAFRQVDGLEQVTLEVRGGVVVLKGRVDSLEDKLTAEELAEKLDGVLTVSNRIEIESQVAQRISPALANLKDRLEFLIGQLPLLLIALGILILFWLLARLVSRVDLLFKHLTPNVFFQDLLRQLTYAGVLLVGALVALEVLNATALVGAVLGTAGITGIAFGFAFKDLAENSLASILLSLRQPFAPNDHVVVDDNEGKVVRLNSRATILLTLDGNHLRIPNSTVFKATILNYTRNPERRFLFAVGVSPDEDLLEAHRIALEALQACPGVMKEPAPQVLVESLGDWTVNVTVQGWVDQTQSEFLKVKSEAIRLVKEAFDQADISMPVQTFQLRHLDSTESLKKKEPVRRRTDQPDLRPERHLEERIEQERESEGADLLESGAPLE